MFTWSPQLSTQAQPGTYRLVAVDLDSILQPSRSLHQADAAALRTAHGAGVKVVLASALSPQSMHRYWAQLGLGTPVIALNGALVYDFPSHRPVVGHSLKTDQVRLILQTVQRIAPKATVGLQHAEAWTANRLSAATKALIQRTGTWPSAVGDLETDDTAVVFQVWVSAGADQMRALEGELAQAGLSLSHYTEPEMLVAQAAGASRGWALSSLAGILEIPSNEVMAVGDGGRDRSMLQAAAFAVLVSDIAKEMQGEGEQSSSKPPVVAEALARYLTVEGSDTELWPSIEP